MQRIKMQNTELELSRFCLGTGSFDTNYSKETAFEILDRFRDLNGNFIDTANVYGKWIPGQANTSEQYLGQWLKSRQAHSDMIIASKGGHFDLNNPTMSRITRQEIEKDLDESLRALGLDHIDFYWLHRDNEVLPIEELIDIMEAFVTCGKVRYYGASNYKQPRLDQALTYANARLLQGFLAVSNQWCLASQNPGGSPFPDPTTVAVDAGFYQWHCDTQIPLVPYSSSAHGFFTKLQTGNVPGPLKKAYLNDRNIAISKLLINAAAETGASVFELAQAWLLHQPFQVFPVMSVSTPDQLEAFEGADHLTLTSDLLKQISQLGVV